MPEMCAAAIQNWPGPVRLEQLTQVLKESGVARESRASWCWNEGFWASLGDLEATTEVMEFKDTSFLVNRFLQWTLAFSSGSLDPFPVLPRCGSDVHVFLITLEGQC